MGRCDSSPRRPRTTADAAAALECDVGAIVSCLVFVLDGEPVVIIKSDAYHVDLELFESLGGGAYARQATPDEICSSTGQPIGGVSPANWPKDLRVHIDKSLRQFEHIWSACGPPNAVFATTIDELSSLTNARPVRLVA